MGAILGQVVASDHCYEARCLRYDVTAQARTIEEALDALRRGVQDAIADDRTVDDDVLFLVTVRTQRYESVIAEPLYSTLSF